MIQTISELGVVFSAEPESEIVLRDVQNRWNAAAKTWDVEGLAAMYTSNALMYGGRPGMSVGREGMRTYFSSYADMLKSTHLELVDQVVIQLAPDTYLAQGYGMFQFELLSGRASGTKMRTTLILVKRENQWKILQHHFSLTPEVPPVPQ